MQIKSDMCSKVSVRGNNFCVAVSVVGRDDEAIV